MISILDGRNKESGSGGSLIGGYNTMTKIIRKPLKSGGALITDSNFNVMQFTEKQAITRTKRFKKDMERGFINGYKFKHCSVSDRGAYWSQCIS